jgi:hypothetical protein
MTPDEVVKVFEWKIKEIQKKEERYPNLVYSGFYTSEKKALTSAISLIQDYQKLREKLSVEKIEKIYRNQPTRDGYYCGNPTKVAQAIITYLGGGE